ncbi:hypothetical protein BKA62DRAFT_794936 [Auriculariales sp. MPI-PUGE-AT-0066]|nr:hypothetical protein BKA62DRAFT_794936 [Auriculariales sp. MPI-PUGE-AT-0066]
MAINPLRSFPYDIRHQIVDEIGAREPAQLYPLLNVDKFSRSLVRDHPAWYGHLVLEHTGASALGIFNSQLVACKEHKRPTDVKVHPVYTLQTDIQDKVFVKIMAILPFAKTISLELCLTNPQALWQRFAAIPAVQLESLHIKLMNLRGIPEQMVLPAHLFSSQVPLLKEVNALFDYSSLAVNPFTTVESVCWELSHHQDVGDFRGSNIVAHYPNARKLVFHGDDLDDLPPDLFSGAPGVWRLEDVEIWGVSSRSMLDNILAHIVTPSIRRISIDGSDVWNGSAAAALVSSPLPLGEPITFKALHREARYDELFVLSLSSQQKELSQTLELRAIDLVDIQLGIDECVYHMLMESYTSYLANVTQLEFDLQLWNQVIMSQVSFSAVHTLVLHVTEKPFWEMLDLEPDVDRLNDFGFFALNQCVHTPRITCLKIIGNATPRVPVEETWITELIATRMSGFDPTACSVVVRSLKLMTADGTLHGFSNWSQLTIEDCEVLRTEPISPFMPSALVSSLESTWLFQNTQHLRKFIFTRAMQAGKFLQELGASAESGKFHLLFWFSSLVFMTASRSSS